MKKIPDGCFFDFESFSGAGNADAGVVIDEAICGDFGKELGSFFAIGCFRSEA